MKFFKQNLPMLLVALFELGVGVMLFKASQEFNSTLFIVFGVVCVLISIVYFVRFIKTKKAGKVNVFSLSLAIILFIVGLLCGVLSSAIADNGIIVPIAYGIILIGSGVFKLQAYFDAKNGGIPLSLFLLISAFLSIAGGVVAVINPFGTAAGDNPNENLMIYTGIVLTVLAVLDIVSVFYNPKKKENAVVPAEETKE